MTSGKKPRQKMRPINTRLVLHELSQIGKAFILPMYLDKKTIPFRPTFVSLEVEETCFFRCKQCNIWKNKRLKDRMNEKQMKKVLDELHRWLGTFQISFSGGEPFSNPYFIPVIEHASQLGIQTHVNTNAYLINETLSEKIIDSGINSISISIDGMGETHNQNRGKPLAFERAEAAIKMLKEGKRRRYFFLSTTTVVMKPNVSELEDLLRWGKTIGLDGMLFQPLWENFSTTKHNPDWFMKGDLWPKPKESTEAFRRLIELKRRGWIVENTLSQLRSYTEYYGDNPKVYGANHPCFVGIKNFAVAINGDVRLCYFFEPVANILNEKPARIWNGKKAQELRERINACQRGCKILLCNDDMSREDAMRLFAKKGKRFISRRILKREAS